MTIILERLAVIRGIPYSPLQPCSKSGTARICSPQCCLLPMRSGTNCLLNMSSCLGQGACSGQDGACAHEECSCNTAWLVLSSRPNEAGPRIQLCPDSCSVAAARCIGLVGSCRCLADLRNSGDLSLRHASAQALARFVEAAKLAHRASEQAGPAASTTAALQGLALVLHRVVMPQIKQGSANANLAVRQVGPLAGVCGAP